MSISRRTTAVAGRSRFGAGNVDKAEPNIDDVKKRVANEAVGTLDVKRRSDSAAVGAKAPVSATPTLASVHGAVAKLTTRLPPDRALLRYSVAGSLAAHKPFVVTFATPRFCTSRTCGPVVDVVDHARRRFEAKGVRFIHVEVYTDNRPALGYNRWMRQGGLRSEPWTFLVGADGRVKS